MTVFADIALAARLEGLCALELCRFVETARSLDAGSAADILEAGGGVAAFLAADSPVNQAFGMGLSGPVQVSDVEAVEHFYLDREARPLIGVAPLAHPSIVEALGARGWSVEGFENVLVREYDAGPLPGVTGVEIREMIDEEGRDLWKLVAATGFSAPLPPLAVHLALAHIAARRPGTRLFVAYLDGKAAGTGELYCDQGVAWLSADTTLPHFRRRGVQTALQCHRLSLGAEEGCDLAVTESAPGSQSQRNMEKLGFHVAYTRADFVLEPGEMLSAR